MNSSSINGIELSCNEQTNFCKLNIKRCIWRTCSLSSVLEAVKRSRKSGCYSEGLLKYEICIVL